MRDDLCHMIQMFDSYNPYDDISIETFYYSLSYSAIGIMKYRQIDTKVSTSMVKSMFPFYTDMTRVRIF